MKLEVGMPIVFNKTGFKTTIDSVDKQDSSFTVEDFDNSVYFYQDSINKKATKKLWAKLFKDNVKVGMTVYHIEEDGSVVTRMVTARGAVSVEIDNHTQVLYSEAHKYIKLRKTLSNWGWDNLVKY